MTIEDLEQFRIGVLPHRPMWQIGTPDGIENIIFPDEFATALLFADEVVLLPYGPRGIDDDNECVVTTQLDAAMKSLGIPFSWGLDLDDDTLKALDEGASAQPTHQMAAWNFVKTDEEIASLLGARCSALLGADPIFVDNRSWDTYQAVSELQSALQRVCLPSLAAVPLEEVLALRERTSDLLRTLRSELLTMTKELRSAVSANPPHDMQREAALLIEQNVVPLVLEANAFLEAERQKHLRRFITNFSKFLGIVTLGVLTAGALDAAGRAVTQAVDTVGEAQSLLSARRHPVKSAQFVLKAREVLK